MPNREPRWPMFQRVWRRAELTDRMITELGIDPIVAARLERGDAYHQACTICLTCPAARNCRNWLNSSDLHSRPPHFCPNSNFFANCRLGQKKLN